MTFQIEAGIRSNPFVENICICTDSYSNHVTALVSPNHKSLAKLADNLSKSSLAFEQLCTDSEVVKHVLKSIRDTSKQLDFSNKEIPVTITLVKEEWSQDNNLLTAALKMRRKQVNEFYSEQIKQMFAKQSWV